MVLRTGTIGINGKILIIETILETSIVRGSDVLIVGNTVLGDTSTSSLCRVINF